MYQRCTRGVSAKTIDTPLTYLRHTLDIPKNYKNRDFKELVLFFLDENKNKKIKKGETFLENDTPKSEVPQNQDISMCSIYSFTEVFQDINEIHQTEIAKKLNLDTVKCSELLNFHSTKGNIIQTKPGFWSIDILGVVFEKRFRH